MLIGTGSTATAIAVSPASDSGPAQIVGSVNILTANNGVLTETTSSGVNVFVADGNGSYTAVAQQLDGASATVSTNTSGDQVLTIASGSNSAQVDLSTGLTSFTGAAGQTFSELEPGTLISQASDGGLIGTTNYSLGFTEVTTVDASGSIGGYCTAGTGGGTLFNWEQTGSSYAVSDSSGTALGTFGSFTMNPNGSVSFMDGAAGNTVGSLTLTSNADGVVDATLAPKNLAGFGEIATASSPDLWDRIVDTVGDALDTVGDTIGSIFSAILSAIAPSAEAAGTKISFQGSSPTQTLLYGASTDVTVTSAAGSTPALSVTSDSYSATLSNGTVSGSAGTELSLAGTNDTIDETHGSLSIASGGTTTTVNGSNDTLTSLFDDTVTLTGNTNTVTANGNGEDIQVFGTGNKVTSDYNDTTDSVIGNDNTVTAEGTGIIALNGNGNVATAAISGNLIDVLGQGSSVTASGGTVDLEAGTAMTLKGAADAIYEKGNGDTLTATGNDNIAYGDGTGEDFQLYGTGNTLTSYGGTTTDSVIGNDNTVIAEGTGIIALNGNGNSATATVSGDLIDVLGQGDSVNANSATVDLEAGTSVGLSGASDAISEKGDGDTLQLSGTGGDTVQASGTGDALTIDSGTNDTVNQSGGSVNIASGGVTTTIDGSNDTLTSLYDDTVTLTGNTNTVTANGNGEDLQVFGTGNKVTSYYNDTTDSVIGNDNTVTAEGSGIIAMNGNGNTATAAVGGDFIDVLGQGDSVNASGSTVDLEAGTSIGLSGASDAIYEKGANDALQLYGTGGDTVQEGGAGDSVIIDGGTGDSVTLSGNDTLTLEGEAAEGYTTVTMTGSGPDEVISDWQDGSTVQTYTPGDSVSEVLSNYSGEDGSGTLINTTSYNSDGSGVSYNYGSGGDVSWDDFDSSHIVSSSGDKIVNSDGSYDIYLYNASGQETSWTDYNSSGDEISSGEPDSGGTGSGRTGTGGTGTGGNNDDPPDGTSEGGSSGVAAAAARKINMVAQYDLSHGDAAAAEAAETAWTRTEQAEAASAGTGPAPSIVNGGSWASSTITWSFATGADSGSAADPVSGAIPAADQVVIEQAMETWATAAGLTLVEVADPSQADIRVGWGDLGTAESGTVGYTSYQVRAGQFQPGMTIRLEDPSETPLVTGADGTPSYSGLGVSLYQAALHEIGHALGLAESSDPESIMFPELGADNTGLDATDIADIEQLYGTRSTALLVQAMASFGAQPPAQAIMSQTATAQTASPLLANPLH